MLVGLTGAFAVLLAYASVSKMVAPDVTARALAGTGLPGAGSIARRLPIRLLSLAELLVALSVLLVGGVVAGALSAVSYAVLAVVAWRLLRRSPGRDCGCFGGGDDPISGWHVAVDVTGSAVGLASVLRPQPSLLVTVVDAGRLAVPVLAGVLLLAYLLYLLMTALPRLAVLRSKVVATR